MCSFVFKYYLGKHIKINYVLTGVTDFMSLELVEGFPVLLVDFGSGTVRVEQRQIGLSDGEVHRIDIFWTKTVSIFYVTYLLLQCIIFLKLSICF